jgi:hypothetical protein
MPTAKHRIAAYLPPEIDEKFQAFKQERGVGDSQALILILSEFLGVSHEVSHASSLDVDVLKNELLSELLGELDSKFSELKDELLGEPLKLVDVNVDSDVGISAGDRLTTAQLAERFGCQGSLVRKQKNQYKDAPEKFAAWSQGRDPKGWAWRFDDRVKLFVREDG